MGRRYELDSLRGLAALSVVFYHALALNSAELTAAIQLQPVNGVVPQILAYTPLHLFWMGSESVWLFFVLSGFVLARSAMRGSFTWSSYYPSRILRLYLPVFAAIVLAWMTYLYPHVLTPDMDQLLPVGYPPTNLLQDLTLVGGTSTSLGVLWSLQWEVIFSLALPLYLFVGRRWPIVSLVVGTVLCLLGWRYNVPAPSFLPMFLIGVVVAVYWERISGFVGRAQNRRLRWNIIASVALVVGCTGMLAYYLLAPHLGEWGRVATVPVTLASIALIIVLVQTWAPLTAVLSLKPLTFLGRVSYSLYLVHLPLVVLFIFMFKPGPVSAVAGIVTALGVAVVFFYVVERPAHVFSQKVRRRIALREAAGSPTSVSP